MFQGRTFWANALPTLFLFTSAAGLRAQTPIPARPPTTPDAQVEANVLRALAGAPDIANQAITTTTVYGVVTLSGSVETEALRTQAETIAARTAGVVKVVDELTLGSQGAGPAQAGSQLPASQQETNPNLPSDGTLANPQPSTSAAETSGSAPRSAGPSYGPGAPEYRQPYGPQPQQQGQYPQQGYPQRQPGYGPPSQSQAYPQGYPGASGGYAQPPQQSGYPQANRVYNGTSGGQPYGGQQAGETVTIPSGALIRMRINHTLDSGRTQLGTTFDGVVVNDVVAGGAVAIPRGAQVQGIVVDAKTSGVLAGRGEMSLQLTQVVLGGKAYPIASDIWAHNGGDKTIQTVNSTAVGTGLGALLGAAAGGGVGAAIGAGVGGALGLGASAASGSGQVYIPSEGMLTFHLAQPATVATVSQEEMNRLAQGAGPGAEPRQLRRRYYPYPAPYPYPYYGPGYYGPGYGYRY